MVGGGVAIIMMEMVFLLVALAGLGSGFHRIQPMLVRKTSHYHHLGHYKASAAR